MRSSHAPPGRQPKDAAAPRCPLFSGPSDIKAANYAPPWRLSPCTPSNRLCSQLQVAQDQHHEPCPLTQDNSWGQTDDTGQNHPCPPGGPIAMACPRSPVLQTFHLFLAVSISCLKVWAGEAWLLRKPEILYAGICHEKERGNIALFFRVCTHID